MIIFYNHDTVIELGNLFTTNAWRGQKFLKLCCNSLSRVQISVGAIVPGGAADTEGSLQTGDLILSIDSKKVPDLTHHQVTLFVSIKTIIDLNLFLCEGCQTARRHRRRRDRTIPNPT